MAETKNEQTAIDDAISPADVVRRLADRGIVISERALRKKARDLGAYREIGREMFFLPADLERLFEPAIPATRSRIDPRRRLTRKPRPVKAAPERVETAPSVEKKRPTPALGYEPIRMINGAKMSPAGWDTKDG